MDLHDNIKSVILAEPTTLVLLGLGLYLLIIVVVAALGAAVVWVLYLTRKAKKEAPQTTPPSPQPISKSCPKCGAPMPPESPEGLCPRCLIALNLATQTDIPGEPGTVKAPPAPPAPIADVAKLFPQLEILECLGRGGMGAVYKARQPRLDRIVALKILSPEKQGNQKFGERFEREARALAKLHHPNIVTVYDFGETQGNFYLLMEFVDGLTLRQLIQGRKLSPAEALAIVPKICEALQYAHEQGIVHRDIKPENILMDKDGRVKIADFGIAKILGDNGSANLTAEQVIGTPHYMSPEQIEKPQSVDHRADIYSLGVVFYEMLTGELPLGKFQPPSKKVHIDVRLDEIVLRTLEKEPERRYQQASEVKTHVETIAASPTVGGFVPALPVQKPDHFWRRFAVVVLALIAIPFLLAIIGFFAAVAIPAFVHGRQRALELRQQEAEREAEREELTSFYIGQTWFPQGDSIEITSVEGTEDQMTVKGHYNLVSHDTASLALNLTSTNSTGFSDGTNQSITISKGSGDFEVTHPHLVVGLPHISMYADGHAFASIYFGTKEEAAEESKTSWITNGTWASVETWSPTLAPGEKPDLQTIMNSAKGLMNEGSYEEALQRYLWYFDHSRGDTGQRGVRVSFALSDWVELGRRYPKAKQALIEIRDADARQFSEGDGYGDLFQEIAGINSYLSDDDATVALFKTIEKRDPKLAGDCFFYVKDLLVQGGDYATCRKYLGDPQTAFERIRQMWQQMKQFEQQGEKRAEDQKERFQAMAKTNSLYAHIPLLPTPPLFADNNFVQQTRQLIEILVATGSKSDAENIQKQALAILDDPRLATAVADADEKVIRPSSPGENSTIINTNHPQVVSVWPPNGAADADTHQDLRIRFDQPMNPNVITINWLSGGFTANGEPHYDAAQNEFVIPIQLLAGKTNVIQVNWSGSGFRNRNSIPADVFKWRFTTRPLATKLDAPRPRVVDVSPRPGETMPVLTMLELTFDQPMTLDRGLPYLRGTGAAFLPGIISYIRCDSSGRRLTIPLLMPPDNETKLTLEGFYSADGAASDPVVVRCEIGTNNYSSAQLNDISAAAKDARLAQLLSSMQAARARLTSGTETVTWISLSQTKDSLRGITVYPATFRWQGTNQFYEDISDIMGGKAFILGTDGKSCWMYSDDDYSGRRFDSNPVESVADMYGSVADPFNLAHNSVQSAISKGKLIYDGQAQLDGRACYCVKSWLVEQTGNEYFPANASRCEWWIDSESYLPVQVVRDGPDYRQIYKFHYAGLNQPLPITAFQPPDTEGARPVDWHHLGTDETRFFTIKDGNDGQMSGRSGKRGPNSSTSSGLN